MGFKIALNPGHWPHALPAGTQDPGAVNNHLGITEADIVRILSPKVKVRLVQLGFNEADIKIFESPTLQGICDQANGFKADVFVSIHCNAFDGVSRGVEIYTYRFGSENSNKLAHHIYNEIKFGERNLHRTPAFWRGELKAGFYVIKHTDMPACLVETGFIDNATDGAEMQTLTWQNMMADAIAQGIKLYAQEKGAI